MERHWKRTTDAAPALLKEAGLRFSPNGPASAELQTANTFPMGSGIASSASSFAADDSCGACCLRRRPVSLRILERNSSRCGPEIAINAPVPESLAKDPEAHAGPLKVLLLNGSKRTRKLFKPRCPKCPHFVMVVSSHRKENFLKPSTPISENICTLERTSENA